MINMKYKKLSLTDKLKLFITKIIKYYEDNIKNLINSYKLGLNEKKQMLEKFNNYIPKELMILRNNIKNCYYCSTISNFNFKYKTIEEDFNRLKIIK